MKCIFVLCLKDKKKKSKKKKKKKKRKRDPANDMARWPGDSWGGGWQAAPELQALQRVPAMSSWKEVWGGLWSPETQPSG